MTILEKNCFCVFASVAWSASLMLVSKSTKRNGPRIIQAHLSKASISSELSNASKLRSAKNKDYLTLTLAHERTSSFWLPFMKKTTTMTVTHVVEL